MAKTRQKLDSNISENWPIIQFEKWWIWILTRNGSYVNLLKLYWKKSWNHIKGTYFWRVLAIWNLCVLCGASLDLTKSFERHVKGFRSSNHRLQIGSVYQIFKNVAKIKVKVISDKFNKIHITPTYMLRNKWQKCEGLGINDFQLKWTQENGKAWEQLEWMRARLVICLLKYGFYK